MNKKVSIYTHNKKQLDDYANQNNSNSDAYKAMMDNRSNQLTPNNIKYYLSRNKNIYK